MENLVISRILQLEKLKNFQILFQFVILSNTKKLTNFRIVCPFDIPHHAQFCRFSYLPFAINEFRCFIFSIFIFYSSYSRKFGRSTFELSLIFKFQILAILRFDCSKFQPSPRNIGRFTFDHSKFCTPPPFSLFSFHSTGT